LPILKVCGFCKLDLVSYDRAGCWVCPEIQDSPLVGLIEPTKSVYVEREQGNPRGVWTGRARHTTCLPYELFDEDFEVTPAIEYARTGKLPSPQAGGRTPDGRRQIVDSRGVPVVRGPGSRESLDTFQCDGCGFRSPSRTRVISHLMGLSSGCQSTRAEAPSGEVIDVSREPRGGSVPAW